MKECDARTDKYMELLDKYGDSDEAEEKIAKEMGWLRELTEEEAGAAGEDDDGCHRGNESRLRRSAERTAARTRTASRRH